MKNPVNVHKDYGDRHPIVWEPDYGYHDIERPQSVWEVNEWFSDMYRNFESRGFWVEDVLDQIERRSSKGIVRGTNYYTQKTPYRYGSLEDPKVFLYGRGRVPLIKPKNSSMLRESKLGFRIVRNK